MPPQTPKRPADTIPHAFESDMLNHPPLGIYLHIPFCESKCSYCNFASGVYPDYMVLPYLKALKAEIKAWRTISTEMGADTRVLDSRFVDTVYLGGGTPSLLSTEALAGIIAFLREEFSLSDNVEMTLEVNPGTVSVQKIGGQISAGVNRVSIGMQTFQDFRLRKLGRSHTVADSLETFRLYRESGIRNISIDLILGLPGQTLPEWEYNLEQVHELNPDHVSLYMLEIHENTQFGKVYGPSSKMTPPAGESASIDALPDEELVEAFYFQAVESLTQGGWKLYEISNFARPGYESRHNLKYWTNQPFLGFGCGAYSYLAGVRWGNERSVQRYIDLMHEQQHAIVSRHVLSEMDQQEEALFLGLRLSEGIRLQSFQEKFGFDLRSQFRNSLDHLKEAGLIELNPETLRLTARGRLLSNEVFGEFMY
ncbi:MAG: radical SAM family heme chaperone HemW [Terriglobia bacterium]